jgi:hypothetical protein
MKHPPLPEGSRVTFDEVCGELYAKLITRRKPYANISIPLYDAGTIIEDEWRCIWEDCDDDPAKCNEALDNLWAWYDWRKDQPKEY